MASRNQLNFGTKLLLGIFTCIAASTAMGGTVYVSKAGADANDGLTWATAKLTVQAGLNAAVSGDEVWVAAGTYVECITLKNGVALYGGFAGNETELTQRNWGTNATILDGNQAGSVVTVPAGATPATRIDGFTIRNGSTSGSGGGINCSGSSTIRNNTITGNSANHDGGGIFCNLFSYPTIANNTITGNIADAKGGGIFCLAASPTVVNNIITGNGASSGGGLYCEHCSDYRPIIMNTIITFNSSGIQGPDTLPLRYNCVYGNAEYDYSGIADPTGTDGNISADPLFLSVSPGPDGTWGTADDLFDDLRLQPGSPCIDAGNNADVPAGVLLDLFGYPRLLDDPATPDCPWAPGTCGTAPIVDMGAYEFASDEDSDGVPDFSDNCPGSDLGETIVIAGRDSGVANQMLDDGCTMSDEIAKAAAAASNHGDFVSAVAELTNNWKKAGLISGADKGSIQNCAARRQPGRQK